MVSVIDKIKSHLKDLEQEQLYRACCEQLGSEIVPRIIGDYAKVTNSKAHAINMKVYNYLEQTIKRNNMRRVMNENLKLKMEAFNQYHRLKELGF